MAVKRRGLTVEQRQQLGKAARKKAPRSSHADFSSRSDRPDPVALIAAQDAERVPWLVPVRHARMSVSPFTFHRGTATVMATDLAHSPISGFTVQACGDAHLANFGLFASPERSMIFDVNDFDETLPGPWEWDVKRLAASFTIAARNNEFSVKSCRAVATVAAQAYRRAMAEFAGKRAIDVWYARFNASDIASVFKRQRTGKRWDRNIAKAKKRDHLRTVGKLTEQVDGTRRIASDPPLLVPLRAMRNELDPEKYHDIVWKSFEAYRVSLSSNRRQLLERYRPVDAALKVVGVGSVGTLCFILLCEGRDPDDLLLLQIKQAGCSVLEHHLPASVYRSYGRRVVEGQWLMQAASDMFLGWTESRDKAKSFYWRQFKDMKGSANIETQNPRDMRDYARMCGWTLARTHARSGDPVAIAAYLGSRAYA